MEHGVADDDHLCKLWQIYNSIHKIIIECEMNTNN